MAAGDILNEVPVFNSPITPGNEVDVARDLEIFQEAVVAYIRRLREALLSELQEIEPRLNP